MVKFRRDSEFWMTGLADANRAGRALGRGFCILATDEALLVEPVCRACSRPTSRSLRICSPRPV